MIDETDVRHLRAAIDSARSARDNGNHPFGALFVDAAGAVLASAENTVVTDEDISGHAELNLIRAVHRELGADALQAGTLYASTEPCAMCAGAISWAGVRRVVFALPATALAGQGPAGRAAPAVVEGPALLTEAAAVHGDTATHGDTAQAATSAAH